MGGSSSRVSAKQANEVVAEAVLSSTAQCSRVTAGEQSMRCEGPQCRLSGNVQRQQLSLDAACVIAQSQKIDLASQVANQADLLLKDKSVAGTQWADASQRSMSSDVSTRIKQSVSAQQIAACAAALNGKQIIDVRGDGSVAEDNQQQMALDMQADCYLKSEQGVSVGNYIANATNQRSEYTSESPLSFIGDAFSALGKLFSPGSLLIILLILVLVAGGYYMVVIKGARPGGRRYDAYDRRDDAYGRAA